MAVQKIKYTADFALAVAAWGTGLTAGQFATSAIFDNSILLHEDAILGGKLALNATTPVTGDTLDIYIVPQYSDTVTDMAGGIDALLTAAAEQVEDTDFVLANLTKLVSVDVEKATPATAQAYQWAAGVFAALGFMPKNFMLLLHNNTAGGMAAGSDVNVQGINHTVA